MKILVTESQYKRILKEEEEQQKVLSIPSLNFFNDDWNLVQKFLNKKGNPPYSIGGNLDFSNTSINSLGNLTSVGGDLNLKYVPIESLGNLQSVGGSLNLGWSSIKSLGNLTSVGGDLNLKYVPIESLGNLQSVGGILFLGGTPLSKKYTEEEIRQMVNVGGSIHFKL